MKPPAVLDRLEALAARYGLPASATERFALLLDLVAAEPAAITSVRDPERGVDVHVADSLVALEVEAVRTSERIVDLGAGGGFPGLALAVALAGARVALVESVERKCAFLRHAAGVLGLSNVDVVNARAEAWPDGREAHDVATARALAPLPVVLEYAAPLLAVGGTLVAWKGRRDPGEEADGGAAAGLLHMSRPAPLEVHPFADAHDRHLYISSKVGSTPNGYPRRPGMARKRPLRASTGR